MFVFKNIWFSFGSLLFWYKDFVNKVGEDKTCLLMHTDVNDQHGQPLEYLVDHLGLGGGQVMFSKEKVPPDQMRSFYNLADCTVCISDAEGFGLSANESLACGTPIIATKTGGLTEQVTDGENEFGVALEPSSKAVIGSLSVPWIYEDRLCKDDVVAAMEKMYKMSPKERDELGRLGIEHIEKNYNFENMKNSWVKIMEEVYEENGSWSTRKNHSNRWGFNKI